MVLTVYYEGHYSINRKGIYMRYTHIAALSLTTLLAVNAYAEQGYPLGQSYHRIQLAQNDVPSSSDKSIEGTDAGGAKQTTIIDENGNLRIINKAPTPNDNANSTTNTPAVGTTTVPPANGQPAPMPNQPMQPNQTMQPPYPAQPMQPVVPGAPVPTSPNNMQAPSPLTPVTPGMAPAAPLPNQAAPGVQPVAPAAPGGAVPQTLSPGVGGAPAITPPAGMAPNSMSVNPAQGAR